MGCKRINQTLYEHFEIKKPLTLERWLNYGDKDKRN